MGEVRVKPRRSIKCNAFSLFYLDRQHDVSEAHPRERTEYYKPSATASLGTTSWRSDAVVFENMEAPAIPQRGLSDVLKTEYGCYVCNYDLGENPEMIERSLQELRSYVKGLPGLVECQIPGDNFLLVALRYCGYNIEKSSEYVLGFFEHLLKSPKFCAKPDIRDPGIEDLTSKGWLVKLPGKDINGSLLFYAKGDVANDSSLHGHGAPYRCFFSHVLTASMDPVLGAQKWTLVLDGHGCSLKQLAVLTIPDLIRFAATASTSPLPFHGIHFIRIPYGIIKKLLTLLLKYVVPQLQPKIVIHDKLQSLYDYVPQSNLPKECGGDIDLQQPCDEWLNFLRDNVEAVRHVTDKCWVSVEKR